MSTLPNSYYLLLTGSVFFLVFSLWLMAVLVWVWRRYSKEQQVHGRLALKTSSMPASPSTHRLWREEGGSAKPTEQKSLWTDWVDRLDQLCQDAGYDMPGHALLFWIIGISTLVAVLVLIVVQDALLAFAALILTIGIASMFIRRRLNKTMDKFETQFVDALGLATRSLRAGHPLPAAFRLIAEELQPPVSTLFAEIWQQQALGVEMAAAIRRTADKSKSPDMKLFGSAVVIQLRSGGNLADMMDRLSHVIRTRIRLHRRVRILTMEAQFSKRILIGLPLVLFLILYALNPEYVRLLYTTRGGVLMLFYALMSMLAGSWLMNRIASLRY